MNASNVFDRTYVASCGSTISCFYGLRRTVLGGFVYKWWRLCGNELPADLHAAADTRRMTAGG